MRARTILEVTALVAAGVLFAGCGDSPAPSKPAPEPPKRAYVLPLPSFELAVLVDQSGSMLTTDPEGRRGDVGEFLVESLSAVEAPVGCPNRAAVFHFGSSVCGPSAPATCGKLLDLGPDAAAREQLRGAVRHPAPSSAENTNVGAALERATSLLRGASRTCAPNPKRLVVVLTDGIPDPDGRTPKGDRAQFEKLKTIWRDGGLGPAARLVVLGLDAKGDVFTKGVLDDWASVASASDKSDVLASRVATTDDMLDQGAQLIATLTGAAMEPARPLGAGLKIDVEPWRARMDLWLLGAGVPRIRRADGTTVDPFKDGRVVEGKRFALVKLDDPPSGTWSVEPAGAPGGRLMFRTVPHQLRLLEEPVVPEGEARPLVAAFSRVDGTPIPTKDASAVPLAVSARVRPPGAAAGAANDVKLSLDPGTGFYRSDKPILYDKDGRWSVELVVQAEAGVGGGKASRWTIGQDVVVSKLRPRLVLLNPSVDVWRWPFSCRVRAQVQVVRGADKLPLQTSELQSLGNLGSMVAFSTGGAWSYMDFADDRFVADLECPKSDDKRPIPLRLRLFAGKESDGIAPAQYDYQIAVSTSWKYHLAVVSGGVSSMLALIYTLLALRILLSGSDQSKAMPVRIVAQGPPPTNFTWNVRPGWESCANPAKLTFHGAADGRSCKVFLGGRWAAALRLGVGGAFLVAGDAQRKRAKLGDYEVTLV